MMWRYFPLYWLTVAFSTWKVRLPKVSIYHQSDSCRAMRTVRTTPLNLKEPMMVLLSALR